jgi:hypothetical protein
MKRMGNSRRKLYHWRSEVLLLSTAIFVLVIPSLPERRFHLLYWVIALVFEVAMIIRFWPFDPN